MPPEMPVLRHFSREFPGVLVFRGLVSAPRASMKPVSLAAKFPFLGSWGKGLVCELS